VNHVDTSDYYGPHVTNQLIKQALYPYAKDLVIVTKVGVVEVQTNPGFPLSPARS
jgi:aryl-alcohol dehydrogenase-like predicted oxidoreductase